jgi:hypothetical protein
VSVDQSMPCIDVGVLPVGHRVVALCSRGDRLDDRHDAGIILTIHPPDTYWMMISVPEGFQSAKSVAGFNVPANLEYATAW